MVGESFLLGLFPTAGPLPFDDLNMASSIYRRFSGLVGTLSHSTRLFKGKNLNLHLGGAYLKLTNQIIFA